MAGHSDSNHLALIHDVSTDGALLLSRHKLEVGDWLQLSLYLLPEDSEPRVTSGKVVRVSRRERDRADVWQWEIGVRFDSPITTYADQIEELCRRQRAIGVLRE